MTLFSSVQIIKVTDYLSVILFLFLSAFPPDARLTVGQGTHPDLIGIRFIGIYSTAKIETILNFYLHFHFLNRLRKKSETSWLD